MSKREIKGWNLLHAARGNSTLVRNTVQLRTAPTTYHRVRLMGIAYQPAIAQSAQYRLPPSIRKLPTRPNNNRPESRFYQEKTHPSIWELPAQRGFPILGECQNHHRNFDTTIRIQLLWGCRRRQYDSVGGELPMRT